MTLTTDPLVKELQMLRERMVAHGIGLEEDHELLQESAYRIESLVKSLDIASKALRTIVDGLA